MAMAAQTRIPPLVVIWQQVTQLARSGLEVAHDWRMRDR